MNQKQYEELELRDDFMFGKVMQNKEICRRTLEILLDSEIEDIEYPEAQKIINITCQGKSVRMDVYVADNTNTVYNAEMQQQGGGNTQEQLPKRSRYYQGMIDLNLIEKGLPYTELNNSCVIFICTFDPFGKDRYQYTFQQVCKEDKSLVLEDGTTKIFYNTKGDLESAPEELKSLLHYIETKEAESPFIEALDREVERIRRNEKWRREYMKELLHDFDIREAGRKEGEERGRAAFRESIYGFLRDLGEIPEELTRKIDSTTDIEVLQSWIKLAAKAKDMKEFIEKMN